MGPFSQPQWPTWAYSGLSDPFTTYQQQFSNYPAYLAESMDTYQAHHNRHLVNHHQLSRTTESKPRLSKEEVDVLEAEFQKNHKPSSSTKKALAESMRVDNARINNWFQNRRAREKKENNIREYEARQRLEKEKAEAESGPQSENARQRDLVASSAPFPEPSVSLKVHVDAALSPSAQSFQETASETTEQSQGSPVFLPCQNKSNSLTKTDVSSVESDQDDDVASVELSEGADGYFAISQTCTGISTGSSVTMESQATTQLADEYRDFMGGDFEGSCFTQARSMTGDSEDKSPQAVDIASRRNRRPAPLSITGSRSHSSYVPKTAIDMSARGDRTSPMRRVASASSSNRVKKSVSTPRSPFFDGVFPTRRSPSAAGPQGSGAPPTPDTPIALNHQGLVDSTTSYSLDNKYLSTDMSLQDPTLRTPPTTPGFMDSLFPMGSGYDMTISEETLVTPNIARLTNGFSVPSVQNGMPGYIGPANTGTNQVQGNSSLLSSQISSAYLNFLGTGVDYSWPDSSVSMRPSSASQQPQGGYLNIASTGFSHVDN
ncbi:Homeodomain-like protein [Purpureocillium lavendulum]|uniref:Homeodomain-like protein n=1 Tax=Purpureocillium lavendulum TaxID=1247861 RepID=A0AB34G609_9HYPO|nr:Homeodomain-like protein [Purpureocillium lavendulum]